MVTRSCFMWKATARINEIDKFIQLERNMYEVQLIWFRISKKISRRFIIGTTGKIFCLWKFSVSQDCLFMSAE